MYRQAPKSFLITALLLTTMVSAAIFATPATGNVITDLSQRDIPIEWDFRGAQILLFGAIDGENAEKSNHDIVIVVQGPLTNLLARKKSRIAGIWVNKQSQPFRSVPGYYSVVSTRALSDIASDETLKNLQLGLTHIKQKLKVKGDDAVGSQSLQNYQSAIVRIMKNEGLYSEKPNGVNIVGNRLFRANISLPANIPVGRFTADVYVFLNGKVVSRQLSNLHITKQGIERTIYSLAYDYPFVYGLICVAIAIIAGLSASLITGRR